MFSLQPKIPLLLTQIKEVAKVFLATNSDYNYTEVSCLTCVVPQLNTHSRTNHININLTFKMTNHSHIFFPLHQGHYEIST